MVFGLSSPTDKQVYRERVVKSISLRCICNYSLNYGWIMVVKMRGWTINSQIETATLMFNCIIISYKLCYEKNVQPSTLRILALHGFFYEFVDYSLG